MIKKIFIIFSLSFLLAGTFFTASVLAQETSDSLDANLQAIGQGADYSTNVDENTLPALIGNVISIILGFVGTIFFILVIVSGIQWMTAGGNEEAVKKAKTRLINSILGLALILAAYGITYLVTNVFS